MTDREKLIELRDWFFKQDIFLSEEEGNSLGTEEKPLRFYYSGEDFFSLELGDYREITVMYGSIRFGTNIDSIKDFDIDGFIKEVKSRVKLPTKEETKAKKDAMKAERQEKIKKLEEEINELEA